MGNEGQLVQRFPTQVSQELEHVWGGVVQGRLVLQFNKQSDEHDSHDINDKESEYSIRKVFAGQEVHSNFDDWQSQLFLQEWIDEKISLNIWVVLIKVLGCNDAERIFCSVVKYEFKLKSGAKFGQNKSFKELVKVGFRLVQILLTVT